MACSVSSAISAQNVRLAVLGAPAGHLSSSWHACCSTYCEFVTGALTAMAKVASLHRMVTDEHVCPFGPKTKALLERQGFTVDDHVLRSREEVEAFKAEQRVDTTPQTFIDGRRIGRHDETRACLGVAVPKDDQTTYQPVLAVVAA